MKLELHHNNNLSKKLAIVIPAYNEEESIDNVITQWSEVAKKYDGNLIVVNDGSKDNTLKIAMERLADNNTLIVMDKENSGHASSCVAGYKWAIENGYEWIFQTDSDEQTSTDDFSKFWEDREDHPFIFGSRIKRGDGFIRYVISRILTLAILLIFRIYVKDSNVPFRLMKANMLPDILEKIPSDLFLANAYLTVLIQKKYNIHWLPITFENRETGTPSVKLSRFFSVGLKVIKQFIKVRKK